MTSNVRVHSTLDGLLGVPNSPTALNVPQDLKISDWQQANSPLAVLQGSNSHDVTDGGGTCRGRDEVFKYLTEETGSLR